MPIMFRCTGRAHFGGKGDSWKQILLVFSCAGTCWDLRDSVVDSITSALVTEALLYRFLHVNIPIVCRQSGRRPQHHQCLRE